MNVYFLILGYGRTPQYYLTSAQQLSSALNVNVILIYLDNRERTLYSPRFGEKRRYVDEANRLYEFSGYNILLTELMQFSLIDDDLVLLINDTATDHHFWWGWLRGIKKIINSISLDKVYGDLRIIKSIAHPYCYIASWMYILCAKDILKFSHALNVSIDAASKAEMYYAADNLACYAAHLPHERMCRLHYWLFNANPFRGWIRSCKFDLMSKSVRIRKGLTIQLEHELSLNLTTLGINLHDIKRDSILCRLSNTIDRMLNFIMRLKYKLLAG